MARRLTARAGRRSKDRPALSLADDTSYARTSSPDGKIESAILLHSRRGIRIELNLHRSQLALWISPQAGRSLSNRHRNFSCRDDHTSIFDRIDLPEISGKPFVRCDYDPFHCVLRFSGQVLHIATLLDEPVVLLWAESEEVVDLKSDKQDSILQRTEKVFAVRHPDRGLVLDFAAALGPGAGRFEHQKEIDAGRSTYARAVLAPRQVLVIGGELAKEKVAASVTRIAATPIKRLLAADEKAIVRELGPGTLVLRGNPQMQRLYDMNKRHLLSVQDASGALRAALKYVYYLIWATDGSVTATSMMQAGRHDFLKRWMDYMLANPSVQATPPRGRFYGQLVNTITKREEFGSLCAVWPAFMYHGLSGDDRFVRGRNLKLLRDVVAWMERYCYDAKLGAIGTYYIGGGSEDPFYGSNDFGWDAAVGSFMNRNCYAPRYQGRLILRAYEFGMNLNQYNMYLMLASVTAGAVRRGYLAKAATIERFLLRLLDADARAYYLLDGKGVTLIPRGQGLGDDNRSSVETGRYAVQNQSPAFFMPRFAELFMNRQRSFKPLTPQDLKHQFACIVYGRLQGLDTEFVDERGIIRSLEISLPYHVRPSRYIPMPWTMVEYLGAEDGSFHDIRPQAFSAGPFQAAVTNLAVRTMPYGIALRGTNYVAELRHYEYLGGHLDIRYRGQGRISAITFNGRPLLHTLVVPDRWVRPGANRVDIRLAADDLAGPVLVYATVRVTDVQISGGVVRFDLTARAQNVLVLRDAPNDVSVVDHAGRPVKTSQTRDGRHLFIEFAGHGRYAASVPLPKAGTLRRGLGAAAT